VSIKLSNRDMRRIRTIEGEKGARKALEYANELIGGYGVEYIAHRDDTSWRSHGLQYVNTGDTYSATVVYDWHTGRFLWGADWGSIVESRPGQYE
jgi:hypothetical protein